MLSDWRNPLSFLRFFSIELPILDFLGLPACCSASILLSKFISKLGGFVRPKVKRGRDSLDSCVIKRNDE
jgi:hypothetical protein